MQIKRAYIIDWRQHDPNPDPVSAFVRGLGLDWAAVVPKVEASDVGAVNASDSWRGWLSPASDRVPKHRSNCTIQIFNVKTNICRE